MFKPLKESARLPRNSEVFKNCFVLGVRAPTRDQTHNQGMCSGRESNRQLFGAQNTQPTEPPWPGPKVSL